MRHAMYDFMVQGKAQRAQDAVDVFQPISSALQVDNEDRVYRMKAVSVPAVFDRVRISLDEAQVFLRTKKKKKQNENI